MYDIAILRTTGAAVMQIAGLSTQRGSINAHKIAEEASAGGGVGAFVKGKRLLWGSSLPYPINLIRLVTKFLLSETMNQVATHVIKKLFRCLWVPNDHYLFIAAIHQIPF
jgi:hypothetical protein